MFKIYSYRQSIAICSHSIGDKSCNPGCTAKEFYSMQSIPRIDDKLPYEGNYVENIYVHIQFSTIQTEYIR